MQQGEMDCFDQYARDALALLKRTEMHACLWYVDQRILPTLLARALERGIDTQQTRELIRQLALPHGFLAGLRPRPSAA
jgi:hypothetical protein